MGDMVILAKSRWRLRAAIRTLVQVTHSLGMRLHREKRFVGRVEGGLDFLGYRIHPSRRLRPSAASSWRLVVCAHRLHEQGTDAPRLWLHVTRWTRRLRGALGGLASRRGGVKRYMVYVLRQLQIAGIEPPRT